MPARVVSIHNAHPRLKLDRRAVTKVIHALDTQFTYTAADLPHLTAAACKNARAQLTAASPVLRATSRWPTKGRPPTSVFGPQSSAVPAGELSLVFLTDAALAQLHADFLDDPSTTDVITFEGDATLGDAGEICVSADTAAAFAKKHRRDFSEELTLYLVHGWLHLAGYDDLAPAKKRRMRAAETRALALLRSVRSSPRFALATPLKR
jgi:probable rRNA maturation factor